MEKYQLIVLDAARFYIEALSDEEHVKVQSEIDALCCRKYGAVRIKKIHGPIKELIIRNHRLLFFTERNKLCIVSAFAKKTQKTPITEIQYAEKMYRTLINLFRK